MKYWISLIGALVLTLFTATALAFTPPPAPTTGYVVDQAGKLSADDIAKLNAKIENVKTSTSNEIGILIVKSLGDENIEDVTHATFKEWKVGKAGLDNGVLVVWAPAERKVRIQTGKGVEGDLTDLQANDIIGKMKPYLRGGDGFGALGLAVDQIGGTIESRRGNAQVLSASGEGGSLPLEHPMPIGVNSSASSGLGWVLLGVPLIGGILFAIFLMFRNKKEAEAASNFSSFNRSTYTPPAPAPVTKPSTPSYSTSPSYTRSYVPSTPAPAYVPSVSSTPKKKKSSSSSYGSSSSSSSSSSSYSSGGSSWGGSSDSGGGGFGGGDSGGGGASGDY